MLSGGFSFGRFPMMSAYPVKKLHMESYFTIFYSQSGIGSDSANFPLS